MSQLENKLIEILGNTWSKVICHSIRNSLSRRNLKQLKTKKLMRLRSKKSHEVPIINLSSFKNLNLEGLSGIIRKTKKINEKNNFLQILFSIYN